jgi:SprA-related family
MPVSAISQAPYSGQQQAAYSVFPKKDSADVPGLKKKDDSSAPNGKGKEQLTPDQEKEVEKLKKRDAEVRAHEQAHVAVGGAYVKGGISYSYEKGPDGQMYAVGGEVSIDTSPVRNDPRATIAKMEIVKAAALAPADPSGADRAVAASAEQEEVKAQQDLSAQKTGQGGKDGSPPSSEGRSNAKAPSSTGYSSQGQKTPNVNPQPQLINMVA